MAKTIKGEVEFEADGESYTLLLDFNALCDLEEQMPGLMDGGTEIKSPSAIRTVFHAGLAAYHSTLSLRDAGHIIHAIGLEAAGDLVKQSFAASFPSGGDDKARPRKAPAKAGAGSGR